MAVNRERIVRRLEELVATPSVTGDEAVALDLVAGWLAEDGADAVDRWTDTMVSLEGDPDYPGREVERAAVPCVAASVGGRRPGPTVVLTGHVDTVPVGDPDRWTRDPLAATVEGDRLYGRGACDMKGGLVAAVEAFAVMAQSRDFAGELRLVAVSGEEDGGTGTLSAIRRGWTGDYVIVAEPTTAGDVAQVVTAHGGALTFRVEVDGHAAHGSTRREGESAFDHLITVYDAMRRLEAELCAAETDPRMAALGLPYATSVGIVRGGEWASNVMESIAADVRVGVALHETIEAAELRFEERLVAEVADDPWLAAHPPRVRRTGAAFGSSSIHARHPLVATLVAAAADLTGTSPVIAGAPYGCDMALWTRVGGCPTVVYGPGDVRLAHGADEWVSLDEVTSIAGVLGAAVGRLGALGAAPLLDSWDGEGAPS